MDNTDDMKKKPEEFWKNKLSPEQYRVLREKGTEAPFSGKFYLSHDKGMYACAACGQDLFSSEAKFDSDCGWPSFDRSIANEHVVLIDDLSLGMKRTEVLCSRCGGHLGHVFDDGPENLPDGSQATGRRFCINSLSLDFKQNK